MHMALCRKRRKHMDKKKRKKWNVHELLIMIDGGLRAGCRQDGGKGGNTFWENCGKIHIRNAGLLIYVISRGRRIKWGHI